MLRERSSEWRNSERNGVRKRSRKLRKSSNNPSISLSPASGRSDLPKASRPEKKFQKRPANQLKMSPTADCPASMPIIPGTMLSGTIPHTPGISGNEASSGGEVISPAPANPIVDDVEDEPIPLLDFDVDLLHRSAVALDEQLPF